MIGTIKRVTPPEGLEIPEGMVYVGRGGKLRNLSSPYFGRYGFGANWSPCWNGDDTNAHYCLPADSPLLEPLPRTVNLPAGFPPVPEEGLEVLGRYPELRAGDIYYSLSDDGKKWFGPVVALYSDGYKTFALRRPPVAKPQFKTVPFDSIADFGDTFPVWVHWESGGCSIIEGFSSPPTMRIRLCGEWETVERRNALNQRWSTSPLTKWKDAKPFTMEVPA